MLEDDAVNDAELDEASIVWEPDAEDDLALQRLSAQTMDFWDNPIDDEVWNNA